MKPGTQPGHRDPAARPRRAASPADGLEGRSPRVRERRRPGEAVEEPARAAGRVRGRGRRGGLRRAPGHPRQGARRARLRRRTRRAGPARRLGARPPPADRRAWLELSVEADVEAVEAVSEILGRVAPGGTSVEPAFELVDEGLGARVDPTRPSIVRAYLPARDPAAVERGRRRGHDGARPSPGVRPAPDRRPDDARRPRGRLGRGVEGAFPGAARRAADRDPPDVAPAPRRAGRRRRWRSTREWRSGRASTRRRGCASPRWSDVADRGLVDGARVLDVGCGSGILAIAAARLGAASVLGVDTDPIAVEATTANAARNRLARRIAARPGQPAERRAAVRRRPRQPDRVGPRRAGARPRGGAPAGGTLVASGIYVDRETEVRDAFAAVGLDGPRAVRRRATGSPSRRFGRAERR